MCDIYLSIIKNWNRVGLCLICLLVLSVFKTNVFASNSNDLQFTGENYFGEEVQITCIDEQRHYYEVVNPSNPHHTTCIIEGLMPDGYDKLLLKQEAKFQRDWGIEYKDSDEGKKFKVTYVGQVGNHNINRYTHGVIDFVFSNEEGDTLTYYLILDGEPYISDALDTYNELYSDRVDLVDPDDHSVIYNIFDKEQDFKKQPERKQYQKINLSDYNVDQVALKITGEHTVPESYSNRRSNAWVFNGEKYFRINGGRWIRFSESNDDKTIISPNLELEKGDNLVEVVQLYAEPQFATSKNDSFYKLVPSEIGWFSLAQVLLIHCDEPTQSSMDSNTDIGFMQTYSWVSNAGDLFYRYKTVFDEGKEQYTIFLSDNMEYPVVLTGIETVNPGAQWSIEDKNGNDISLGRIGRYIAFNTEGRSEIYIRIVSADGIKTTVKRVVLLQGDESSKAYLTSLRFDSEDIILESAGTELAKSEGKYILNDTNQRAYTVEVDKPSFQIEAECSPGGSIKIDGKEVIGDQVVEVNPGKEGLSKVIITAADGITKKKYYLLYRCHGEYPYFGISESTKELAGSLLQGYRNHMGDGPYDLSDGYWSIFMAKAAGLSLDGSYAFDIRTKDYNIVSDYASAVLELVSIGENPYNFDGVDYVQETLDCLDRGAVGGWNSSLWALLAFKAAGYEYPGKASLTKNIMQQAQNRVSSMTWSIDTSSWAWEGTVDEFPPEDRAEWSQWIYDENQCKSGDEAGIFQDHYYEIPNSYTHGCVLSALNAMNIDPEKFTVGEGKSPLLTLKDQYMVEGGKFKYNNEETWGIGYTKDIIVALGDLSTGKSVWDRMSVDKENLENLIQTAQTLRGKGKEDQNNNLEKALAAAINVEDITKEGRIYFELMDVVREIAPSAVSSSRMCSPATGEKIDALIQEIDSIGEVTANNTDKILELQKAYDALPDNITKRYVTNYDVLKEAVKRAEKIKAEQGATIETKTTPGNKSMEKLFKVAFKPYSSSIKLKWTKINGVKGYDIFRYNPKTKSYRKLISLNAYKGSYMVKRLNGSTGKKLKDGTKYTFKVSAYRTVDGKKKYIKSIKIKTTTRPKKVSLVKIKKKGKRTIIVTWKKVPRCSGYEVWVKGSGKKYECFCIIQKRTTYKTVIKRLIRTKKYSFKIRSYVSLGKKKVYSGFSKKKTIVVE